jgi:serine protease Do
MSKAVWLAVAACVVMAGAAGPVRADSQRVLPRSAEELQLSYAPLVKHAAPAVVNIYTRKVMTQRRRSPLFDDPFFKHFFGDRFFGRQRDQEQNALGSGVIVDPNGIIVTNNHVIEDADEITVSLPDRREFEAELVLADERTDLAVLRVDTGGDSLPSLELHDSDDLEVGDIVLAIGNPFGVGQTVTSGIVSALARTRVGVSDYQFFIQTDAAINPGNSGGALITMDGKVVGINTAIYASRGGGSVGIGFAIPSNMVSAVLASARNGGKVVRPWLGASGQPVTADVASGLGLDRPGGILVNAVYPGGPADEAGLQIGDVIVAVDGKEVVDAQGLRFRVATRPVGETATLSVLREGENLDLDIALKGAPEKPERNVTELKGRHPFAGLVVGNLSPAFAEELGIDSLVSGVVVLDIQRGSPARRLRLRPGDILVSIDDTSLKTVKDIHAALAQATGKIRLVLRRRDKMYNLVIQG